MLQFSFPNPGLMFEPITAHPAHPEKTKPDKTEVVPRSEVEPETETQTKLKSASPCSLHEVMNVRADELTHTITPHMPMCASSFR